MTLIMNHNHGIDDDSNNPNYNGTNNNNNASSNNSSLFSYQTRHFTNPINNISNFTTLTNANNDENDDYDGNVCGFEFAKQVAMQCGDKNREKQAEYYNKNKSDDPWKNIEKVKFKLGTKTIPGGEYCMKNLGLAREGDYNLGDIYDTSVIIVDADYIIPAEQRCTIIEVSKDRVTSLLKNSDGYNVYRANVLQYLKERCSEMNDVDDI